MTAATALRDQGITDTLAADTAPHRCYAQLIREAVTAMRGQDVTSDTIRAWIETHHPDARPHHPNVIPGAMHMLARAGRLRRTNEWRESTRTEARGRILRVWLAT